MRMSYRNVGSTATSDRRSACCSACVFVFFLVNVCMGIYYWIAFRPTMELRRALVRSDGGLKYASDHGSNAAADFGEQHDAHFAPVEPGMPFVRVAMSLWRPFLDTKHPRRRSLCHISTPVVFSNQMGSTLVVKSDRGHPPLLVPPPLLLDFTLNGTVKLVYRHKNEAAAPNASATRHRSGARRFGRSVLQAVYKELLELEGDEGSPGKIRGREGQLQLLRLLESLAPQVPRDEPVLVFGTLEHPVVEVAALAYLKAKRVVSVDYRPAWYEDRRLTGVSHEDFWTMTLNSSSDNVSAGACNRAPAGQVNRSSRWRDSNGAASATPLLPTNALYSMIISYSVVQHDGLGRYGDAVDPYGDVAAVAEMYLLLRPGGILVLGVPIGNDCVSFNTFRVYGRRRLGLLMFPWHVERALGFSASGFEQNTCDGSLRQHALLVLRKPLRPGARLGNDVDLAAQWAVTERAKVPGLTGLLPMHG